MSRTIIKNVGCKVKNVQKTIILLGNMNCNLELTLKEYELKKQDIIYDELDRNFSSQLNFLFSNVFKCLHMKRFSKNFNIQKPRPHLLNINQIHPELKGHLRS